VNTEENNFSIKSTNKLSNTNQNNSESFLINKANNLLIRKKGLRPLDHKGIFGNIVRNNFTINPDDKEQYYYLISVIECVLFNKKFYNELSDLMNRFNITTIGELFSGNISDKNEIDVPNEMRDNIVTLENYLNKIITNFIQLIKLEFGLKNKEYQYQVNLYFKAFIKSTAYYNSTYFPFFTEKIIHKNEKLITEIFCCENNDYYLKRNLKYDISNYFDSEYSDSSDQKEFINENLTNRKNDYRDFISDNLNFDGIELMKNELKIILEKNIEVKFEEILESKNLMKNNENPNNKLFETKFKSIEKQKINENKKIDLRIYKSFDEIKRDLKFLLKNPNYGLPWIIFRRILIIIYDTYNFSN
jgi:hypothetical protein